MLSQDMSQDKSQTKVTVYYDGLCQLCSREIAHYKKMRGADNIHFLDITNADFDAKREDLDPIKVHQTIHAKDQNGKIHLGVDAFLLIWSQLNAMKFLPPLASLWPIKKSLDGGYFVFAKLRPYLPRKSCADSPYCEIKK
jgi:predicted DCC family thiol-disulfide oxidoreductase YuxK